MVMHIDKLMGGRVRDRESVISTTPGGNEELKQFIQNLINNSTISLDQILGFSNISNELKTSISILMALINGTNLEVGDEITIEMKQYFDNLLQSITDTIQMIIDSPNVNQEFKTYLQNLLTNITNAFSQLIVGGVITTELKTLIDNLLQSLTEAINQVTINSITNELKDYINQILNVNGDGSRLISGSVVWLQNLDFLVSPLVYSILNKRIESTKKTVTIPANTSENPMFAIIIADIFGNVSYVLGTPSATPAVPIVNPSTQLLITSIYIPAHGTAPGVDPNGNTDEIVTETIYNENIEWATAKTEEAGVSIDLEATTDPAIGQKHIKFGFAGGISSGVRMDLISTRKTAIFNGKALRMSMDYHEMFPGHDGELILSLSELFPDNKTDFVGSDNNRHVIFYKMDDLTDLIIHGSIGNTYSSPYNLYCSHVEKETYEIPELNFSVEIPGFLFFARMDGVPVITNENYQLSIHDFSRNEQRFGISTVQNVSPVTAAASFARATEIDCKGGVFSLSLKNSTPWTANTGLLIDLYNLATKVGSLTILANQYHGFTPASTEYQRINLSFADFSPTGTKITKMEIRPVNEWMNGSFFNIDNVTLQTGLTKPTGEITHAEILKLIADEVQARTAADAALSSKIGNSVLLTTNQRISDIKTFEKFPEIIIPSYMVGGSGPAGGIIIYDKWNDDGGWRYLEAAPNDLIAATWWNGAYIATGATQMVIGSGLANTETIVSAQGNTGNYAAKICRDFVLGGFSDWFLPSFNEAELLALIGLEGNYWTSTENGDNGARIIILPSKGWGGADKSTTANIRPIRRFSSQAATPTKPEQLASKAYVDRKAEGTRIELTNTEIDFSAGDIFVKTLTADTTLTVVNPVVGKEILLIVDGNHALNLPGTKMGAMSYNGLASNYISFKCIDATIPSFIFSVDRKSTDLEYDLIDEEVDSPMFEHTITLNKFTNILVRTPDGSLLTYGGGIISNYNSISPAINNFIAKTDRGAIRSFNNSFSFGYSSKKLILTAENLRELVLTGGNITLINNSENVDMSVYPELKYVQISSYYIKGFDLSLNYKLEHIDLSIDSAISIIAPDSIESNDFQFTINAPIPTGVINAILAKCRNYSIPSGLKIINLGSSLCAAPTGQGLTDKAALIAAGWTIYTK